MAPWAPLLAAQVLLVVPTSGGIALSGSNDRSSFRNEPALFDSKWGTAELLSGRPAVPGAALDAALCSLGDQPVAETWADLLYPSRAERGFMGDSFTAQCRGWWWVSYVVSSAYLLGLWAGTASMKDRKPYDLRAPLVLWNLLLAIFSLVGALRTAPHLLLLLWDFGFEYTVCRAAVPSYGNGPSGLWVLLFIYSKYFELVDTLFLVLRKRKVGFLHWYHHCSVLLYCWHAYMWETPTGIYFTAMNYSVHAIMYFYYFLAATCSRPPKWGLLVTILQLVQMAVGIAITLSHLRILLTGTVQHCDGHIPNLTAALGMYASYFVLFAQFLFNRYCLKRGREDARKLGKAALMAAKLE